jgi:hypothetical protein
VITSKETEDLLTEAFTTFRDSLPMTAFYNVLTYKRGKDGPFCFLTDDCVAEINALRFAED